MMVKEIKYMQVTVESFPFGMKTKYFYLPVIANINIGDVLTSKSGAQYRIIDGKTNCAITDIDLTKYILFE